MDFKLLSHPEVLLRDHLIRVCDTGLRVYKKQNVFPRLEPVMSICFLAHDLAKGSQFFQDYLRHKAPSSKKTLHSEVSALWGFFLAREICEIDSFMPYMVYGAIRHHHSNLPDFSGMFVPHLNRGEMLEISFSMDYKELNDILSDSGLALDVLTHERFVAGLEEFKERSISYTARKLLKCQSDNAWLEFNYLFSLLIWADKNEAIFKSKQDEEIVRQWTPELVDNFVFSLQKKAEDTPVQTVRTEAYRELNSYRYERGKILSINIPTGSGKTLASLKVAQNLREKHPQLERIIYCLPFTSIIDQNSKVFRSVLEYNGIEPRSDILLPHHHLVELVYSGKLGEMHEDKAEFMIETWNSELIITTFVQIMLSFLSNRNRNLKRFHRLANSVIILDEIQSFPRKYWKLLNQVLTQISEQLNVYVLLVTATQPLIFDPEASEISELAESKLRWFSMIDRVQLDSSGLKEEINIEQLARMICMDCEAEPSLNRLVILNTIKASLSLYKILAEKLPSNRLLYLSSNIVPIHRLERIASIKSSVKRGMVVVSTQVVEAGVDIDLDVVYRDLAPLDSIIQSCGRCNRNAHKSNGLVKLIRLTDGNRQYWRYIYDEVLIDYTLKSLGNFGAIVNETDFYQLSREYYRQVSEFNSNDSSDTILRWLRTLKYETALHPTKENPDAFRLIEDLPMKTVFVEVDVNATELLNEYSKVQSMMNVDKFTHLQIKKDIIRRMKPYMITVSAKYFNSEQPIEIIDHEQLNVMYDITTGFRRELDQKDYIF